MLIERHQDPVQCKTCGFAGPAAASAACPLCRTAYHANALPVFSRYTNSADEVLRLVTEVLGDKKYRYQVAVVRKVDGVPGVYHVGSLARANMADNLTAHTGDLAQEGDVVFLSYNQPGGSGHRVLRWGEPEVLRQLVS